MGNITTPRKLAILPNQEGFEFVAVYKNGIEKIQKVVKVDGIHTTENFKSKNTVKTSKAMKEQGLRYFSSLIPGQKDKTIFNILAFKHGLTELPVGLVKELIFEINDREVSEKMKKTKVFKSNGYFYPLNFTEIIKK
jgi:hypothetical protein